MSDKTVEKHKLIKEMLAMQHQFMDYDRQHGVDPEDYFAGKEGHALHGYKEKYAELATRLVELAHEQKGSHR